MLKILQDIIGLFRSNKEASKAALDVAFTEHAAAIQDANRVCEQSRAAADAKLWEAIKSHLDQRGADADEVSVKAGEYEAYAEMIDADHQRMRQLAETFAKKIDPPPDKPSGVGDTDEQDQ